MAKTGIVIVLMVISGKEFNPNLDLQFNGQNNSLLKSGVQFNSGQVLNSKERKVSSKLENFKLTGPMLFEFQVWIRDDISDRLQYINLSPMTESLNDDILKCLQNHTNQDYLTCSDSLTSDLENVLISHGVSQQDAIRLAWKWND